MLPALFRRHCKELVCGRCGSRSGAAVVRPFALVQVTDARGRPVAPLQGAVAARVAQTRLAAAEDAADRVGRARDEDLEVLAARRGVEYLHGQVGEIAFDLDCPSCEIRHWRSLPDLVRQVRGTASGTLTL
jgi:hypothetical protein